MKADPAPITTTEPLPGAFAELVAAGCEALQAGDLDQARSSFEAAVQRCPDEPVGHNNLGAFYMGLGEFPAAAASFRRVTELMPEHANSHFNLGMAFFQAERFTEAEAAFATAVDLAPEDPEAINNLGAAHYMLGEYTVARQHFTTALTLQANYPNAVLNLCDVELVEGNRDAARELCEAYLAHHHDLGVLRRLLELLDDQARAAVEDAIPHAEAIIAASDEDRATRRHLGRLLEARQALTAEG